jgi:hypothetical protein
VTASGDRVLIVILTARHFADLGRVTGLAEAFREVERALGGDFSTDAGRYARSSPRCWPWFASQPTGLSNLNETSVLLNSTLLRGSGHRPGDRHESADAPDRQPGVGGARAECRWPSPACQTSSPPRLGDTADVPPGADATGAHQLALPPPLAVIRYPGALPAPGIIATVTATHSRCPPHRHLRLRRSNLPPPVGG